MRTYFSPIGFNSTSVTRAVSKHGVGADDEVVLLRPAVTDEDARATEAIEDVRRFLRELDPGITLTTERVAHTSYERAVLDCSDLLRAATGEIVVTLGGGPREVLLPFMTAALAYGEQVETALFFSDLTGGVTNWELPRLTSRVSEPALETLALLGELTRATEDDAASVPDLTERTNRAKSTVTRHVDELEAAGLAETWREGKVRQAQITTGGELRLDVL